MTPAEYLLLIPLPDFQAKIDEYFQSIHNDPGLLSNFVNNPTESMLIGLLPDAYDVTQAEISTSNRLLYSILANNDFKNWVSNYQTNLINSMTTSGTYTIDKDAVLQDVVGAIVQYGDQNIVYSLVKGNMDNDRKPKKKKSDKIEPNDYLPIFLGFVLILVVVVIPWAIVRDPVNSNLTPGGLTSQQFSSLFDQLVAKSIALSNNGDLVKPCIDFV